MLHQKLEPHGWSQRPGAFTDRGLIPCRGKQAGAGSLEGSSGLRSPGQSGHCSLPVSPDTHRDLAVQCPIDGLEGHAHTELQKNFGVTARPAGGQLRGTQTHRACSVTQPLPGETAPARVLDTAAVTAGGTRNHTCARSLLADVVHTRAAWGGRPLPPGFGGSREAQGPEDPPGAPADVEAACWGRPVKGMAASDFESPDIYTI